MQWPDDIIDKIHHDVRMAVQAKHGVVMRKRMGWKQVHTEMEEEHEMYMEYNKWRTPIDHGFYGLMPGERGAHEPQVAFSYDTVSGRVFDPTSLSQLGDLDPIPEDLILCATAFAVGCESLMAYWN